MAKVDLFVSKGSLASGAAQMPYMDTGARTAAINPALFARGSAQIASATNEIAAVYQAKRDLEVRAAHASYLDQVKDNAAAEAFRAKDRGAPLKPLYKTQMQGGRTLVQQDGLSTYRANIAQFNRTLLASIDDTKVQKLVAASIPSALRATDWDVASHYRTRAYDALYGERIAHNENILDGLTATLSLHPDEWSFSQMAQAREYYVAAQNMHRSLADDGFTTHEQAATDHETAFNSLAKNIFKGAIQHAFHKGATIVTDDGVDVVQTPELLRLREILSSEENVQRYGAELADRLDLPEPMILQLETDDRIALLGEVDTQIDKVKSEYREDVKFRQQQSDRAQEQRHDANRRAITGRFGTEARMSNSERQEYFQEFHAQFGFLPSGRDGSLSVTDIQRLVTLDKISPEFGDTLVEATAKGFVGDQDARLFINYQERIADADIDDLDAIKEEFYDEFQSLGFQWVKELTSLVDRRRDKTPAVINHTRARDSLMRRFGGFKGQWDYDTKQGRVIANALKRFDAETLDDDGSVIPGLDYDGIAQYWYDQLAKIDKKIFVDEIRPLTANKTFQALRRDRWGGVFLDENAAYDVVSQSTATLDILDLLISGDGVNPIQIKQQQLISAGVDPDEAANFFKTPNPTIGKLKRLMGIPPDRFTTRNSIRAAREDLERLIDLRERVPRTKDE